MREVKDRNRLFILALAIMGVLALAACSDNFSNLGQFFEGRTLTLSVMAIETAPELRYTDFHTDGNDRDWRLLPSDESLELVFVQLEVANHTAINAIVDVDQQSAELRDFFQGRYFPINVGERLHEDLRGQAEVTVHMDQGQCFDPIRMYIDRGTKVNWVNDGSSPHFVQLEGTEGESHLINSGEMFTHIFPDATELDYECGAEFPSDDDADSKPTPIFTIARVVVEDATNLRKPPRRPKYLLNGSFELAKGMGVDGWLVFEAPKGTKFRDLRWRAGDSITVTF